MTRILRGYYNPGGMFREVFAWCPDEPRDRQDHGMLILGGRSRSCYASILRKLRPDVVRAYGGYWAADQACASRLDGVPVVVSVHDPHPSMLHKSVRYADLVACVSPGVEQAVLKTGVEQARIRSLPNRVDRSVFRPVTDSEALRSISRRFPPGRFILHVGRKSREKNLETVIRALGSLTPDYQAIFVGRGSPRPYMQLAEKAGVSQRCHWIESVANEELPRWYSWCDCMCTPSLWEGFGTVFVEAAACGAAIVTSDIAPMNAYLRHGATAHLVRDYVSPLTLAEAIRSVCENSDYRAHLRRCAVTAAEPFDLRHVEMLEQSIYREALDLQPRTLTPRQRLELTLSCVPHRFRTGMQALRRRARRCRHAVSGSSSRARERLQAFE